MSSVRYNLPAEPLAALLAHTVAEGDCRLWTGARGGHRNPAHHYGYVRFQGRAQRVHRLVYRLVHGRDAAIVRHSCDRPLCIAPDHLLGGTQADNVADGVARGRYVRTVDYREVARLHAAGLSSGAIGLQLGAPRSTIKTIIRRLRLNLAY